MENDKNVVKIRRRNNDVIIYEKINKSVRFLYHTFLGRICLKIITRRWISKLVGKYMNSKLSRRRIKKAIKQYGIDMNQYENINYQSYNHFFTRKLKENICPINYDNNVLISPCDAKLSVYKIDQISNTFNIKESIYNINDLINDSIIASNYIDGYCLIFRLTVDDYHRYCYIDDGYKEENHFIKGILHTVQPISLEKYKVFHQNCREYTILHTNNFFDVLHIEVGAICVGKIKNLHQKYEFHRGEEKGMFEFGGSTIILLFSKDTIIIDQDIINNSNNDIETIVKMGEKIGIKQNKVI